MILISLLIAIGLDRVVTRSDYWRSAWVTDKTLGVVCKNSDGDTGKWRIWLGLVIPALLLMVLECVLFGNFITFIVQTLVLFLALGCSSARSTYKNWLQSAQREDAEACDLYAMQLHKGLLGRDDDSALADDGTLIQRLLLLANFQFYAAVIIFFIVLGGPGALLYMTVREAHRYFMAANFACAKHSASLLHILEWIPARLTAFGFLVVGHFSRALPVWLEYVSSRHIVAEQLLWRVGRQAEIIEPKDCDACSKMMACTHVLASVRLAKRNILFLLVVAAVLTLSGWLV
ncbi:regulatory signaling modulator protein AmpE [Alteromonas sp. C1M14]|uniref:regulatory signaling modulator protein AmpE n=1 Tax=Alteromonas sp. C1M14 TaxID=2841567 RepID=UPI001C089A15|nr:regulatory signaling modulator protein AmpE [Alteromonas sp. C1M14]